MRGYLLSAFVIFILLFTPFPGDAVVLPSEQLSGFSPFGFQYPDDMLIQDRNRLLGAADRNNNFILSDRRAVSAQPSRFEGYSIVENGKLLPNVAVD